MSHYVTLCLGEVDFLIHYSLIVANFIQPLTQVVLIQIYGCNLCQIKFCIFFFCYTECSKKNNNNPECEINKLNHQLLKKLFCRVFID